MSIIRIDVPTGENGVMTGQADIRGVQVSRNFVIHDPVGRDENGVAITHIHTKYRAIVANSIHLAINACEALEECGVDWATGSVESIREQAALHQEALQAIIKRAHQ